MLVKLAEILSSLGYDQTIPSPDRREQQIGQQLGLLVEQKRLGLNVEPLLAEAPLLAGWLESLEQLIPGLYDPRKRVYPNLPLTVPAAEGVVLELTANVGFVGGKVKVLQWDVREAALLWSDRVRAWALCRSLSLAPQEVEVVVCAFSLDHPPVKQKYAWDERLHAETAAGLAEILIPASKTSGNAEVPTPRHSCLDLDMIDELSI